MAVGKRIIVLGQIRVVKDICGTNEVWRTQLNMSETVKAMICLTSTEACVFIPPANAGGTDLLILPSVLWWRRRELNPDPKVNAEGLYMLSCFSFRVSLATRATFAHLELSESARRSNGLVRLWSRPSPRTEAMGQLI